MYNNESPLVSICSITFNHEPYIRDAIEGFLMQKTDFKFEIIIYDDASTDNTASIIKEYANKFPNLFKIILQKENQYSKGVRGIAVNFTFPHARGKYISLCEGDDYWTDPYKLQKQISFLEQHSEYSFCFHNSKVYYVDKKYYTNFNIKLKQKSYSVKDLIKKQWFIPTASIVLRKDSLPEAYPDWFFQAYSGDYALELILAMKCDFFYLDDIMSVYRKNSISSLSVSMKYPHYHLEKKLILLKEFNKYSGEKYNFHLLVERFIILFQILRSKIYNRFPQVFIFKESILNLLKIKLS
jgi:glycosyltransferase involved in cell wall biosynthesis